MAQQCNPRVGIVSDSKLLQHMVAAAVRDWGYDVALNIHPHKLDSTLISGSISVDIWLIELENEAEEFSDCLDALIEATNNPILFGDGAPPSKTSNKYNRWQKRMFGKLESRVGPPLQQKVDASEPELKTVPEPPMLSQTVGPVSELPVLIERAGRRPQKSALKSEDAFNRRNLKEPMVGEASNRLGAETIWVVGSSLGGPHAVKAFFDALPADIPVAFVLAQHIDPGFHDALAQVLGRDNSLKYVASPASGRHKLAQGDVLICAAAHQFTLSTGGTVGPSDEKWKPPYAPSIDQAVSRVAEVFGVNCGAIIFTGMGEDGSLGVAQMAQLGGAVWAQAEASCADSSMPNSARATGCVSFSGTPKELADKLAGLYLSPIADEIAKI